MSINISTTCQVTVAKLFTDINSKEFFKLKKRYAASR